MAWDSSRPVPWQRLIREWLVYLAVMAVVFVVFFRDGNFVGIITGLLASGPIFLFFGWLMAKFGYERTTLRQRRSRQEGDATNREATGPASSAVRPKPAPTKRTGGGDSRQRPSGARKRR